MRSRRDISTSRLRNFVFGVEDSLVSTVGLLSGIAMADVSKQTILLTGIVLIFVEAFSMAVGSFLSENSADEYAAQTKTSYGQNAFDGVIMFLSYFISGFVPIFPYIIFPVTSAFWISIVLSLFALFLLGATVGRFAHLGILRGGLRMCVIGGLAILVGSAIGALLNKF
ncbi:MAG: VIT1/CCC1 transporter family protein [Patescibacteria group bacterium]